MPRFGPNPESPSRGRTRRSETRRSRTCQATFARRTRCPPCSVPVTEHATTAAVTKPSGTARCRCEAARSRSSPPSPGQSPWSRIKKQRAVLRGAPVARSRSAPDARLRGRLTASTRRPAISTACANLEWRLLRRCAPCIRDRARIQLPATRCFLHEGEHALAAHEEPNRMWTPGSGVRRGGPAARSTKLEVWSARRTMRPLGVPVDLDRALLAGDGESVRARRRRADAMMCTTGVVERAECESVAIRARAPSLRAVPWMHVGSRVPSSRRP